MVVKKDKEPKPLKNEELEQVTGGSTGSETFTTKDKQEPNNPYEIHVYEDETKNPQWKNPK